MPIVSLLLIATALEAGVLPAPTGPYRVGRVTVEWTDRSRMEPLAEDRGYRTLPVDIWYPADASSGPPAPYLDIAAFERAIGAAGTRRQLAPAYDVIKDGRAQTHAVAAAPFTRAINRAPVIIFSPGGGMVREVYAAQLSDLASHGFIVTAITHPYDGIVTVYRDGHTVKYDAKRWPQTPDFPGTWSLNQLDWHARDIRFVLDQLVEANRAPAPTLPFAGHLDLTRVGALGHSFGGVAAAKACQTDQRISACLNEDGLAGKQPFDVNGGHWSKHQRYMLIQIAGETGPPPDEELTKMHLTRAQATDTLARLDRDHDAALRLPGGSYEVVMNRSKAAHMDFTDLPILGAKTQEDADTREHLLATVRSLTLAFFEQSLRGKRSAVLENAAPGQFVQSAQRFGAAR